MTLTQPRSDRLDRVLCYVTVNVGVLQALAKMDPGFRPMMDGVLANRAQWERLDAERLSKHAILETGV